MCVYARLHFFFYYYFWDRGISTSSFFSGTLRCLTNLLIGSKNSQQNDVIIFFGTFPFPCLSSSVPLYQRHPHPIPFSLPRLLCSPHPVASPEVGVPPQWPVGNWGREQEEMNFHGSKLEFEALPPQQHGSEWWLIL